MFPLLLVALSPSYGASVTLRVANPVAVEVPVSVHSIGVGHRNLPADKELHPGIFAESEHTGEVPGADFKAANDAVEAAYGLLAESGRFEVVNLGAVQTEDRRGRFAEPMLVRQVAALCKTYEVQALLLLEGLDTDIEEEGKEVVRGGSDVFEARQLIEGRALWRTYRCNGTVIDEDLLEPGQLRFEERSFDADADAAWKGLPEASENMEKLGKMVGLLEGRRLAPSWAQVTRSWIPGGSEVLKAAAVHVRADDWSGAIEAWSDAYDSAEGKVKGKAAYNLAVAAERSGDMLLANEWLQLAVADWPSGKVSSYQGLLDRRAMANQAVARMDSNKLQDRPETPEADLILAIPAHKEDDSK